MADTDQHSGAPFKYPDDEWEVRQDESTGQQYYYNIRTGEASWEAPALTAVHEHGATRLQQWTEAFDESGRVYYVNLETMETAWEPPPGFVKSVDNSTLAAHTSSHFKDVPVDTGFHRPTTAEQMERLNALLSGEDGDDGEEEEGGDNDDGGGDDGQEKAGDETVKIEGHHAEELRRDEPHPHPLPHHTGGTPDVTDGHVWMMFYHEDDGVPYYYNHITGECVWEPPAEFLQYHHDQQENGILDEYGDHDGPYHGTHGVEAIDVDVAASIASIASSNSPDVNAPSEGGESTERGAIVLTSGRIARPASAGPHVVDPLKAAITPEFEEKVRQAIKSVSKTPVGSSRLVFVHTPTLRRNDEKWIAATSGRAGSRPSSSSLKSSRVPTTASGMEQNDANHAHGGEGNIPESQEGREATVEDRADMVSTPHSPDEETASKGDEDIANDQEGEAEKLNDPHSTDSALHSQGDETTAGNHKGGEGIGNDQEAKEQTRDDPLSTDNAAHSQGREAAATVVDAGVSDTTDRAISKDGSALVIQCLARSLLARRRVAQAHMRAVPPEKEVGTEKVVDTKQCDAVVDIAPCVVIADVGTCKVFPDNEHKEDQVTSDGPLKDPLTQALDIEAEKAWTVGNDQNQLDSSDVNGLKETTEGIVDRETIQRSEEPAQDSARQGIENEVEKTVDDVIKSDTEIIVTSPEASAAIRSEKTNMEDVAVEEGQVRSQSTEQVEPIASTAELEQESRDDGESLPALNDSALVSLAVSSSLEQPLPELGAGQRQEERPVPQQELLANSDLTQPSTENESTVPAELSCTVDNPSECADSIATSAHQSKGQGSACENTEPAVPISSSPPAPAISSHLHAPAILAVSNYFPTRSLSCRATASSIVQKTTTLDRGIAHIMAVAARSLTTSKYSLLNSEERARQAEERASVRDVGKQVAQHEWQQQLTKYQEIYAESASRYETERARILSEHHVRKEVSVVSEASHESASKLSSGGADTNALCDDAKSHTVKGLKESLATALSSENGFVQAMRLARLRNMEAMVARLHTTSNKLESHIESIDVYVVSDQMDAAQKRFQSTHRNHLRAMHGHVMNVAAFWQDQVAAGHSNPGASTYWDRIDVVNRAIFNANVRQERWLFELGERDNGDSVLHAAAWRGDHEPVDFLLSELRMDVNAVDNSATRWTPLHEACRGGHVKTVTVLLHHHARLLVADYHGDSPLHLACRLGFVDIVRVLIAAACSEQPELPSPDQAVWPQLFHHRNYKHKRAIDVARLASLVELLSHYEDELQTQEQISDPSAVNQSTRTSPARRRKVVTKKKGTRPHSASSSKSSNSGGATAVALNAR